MVVPATHVLYAASPADFTVAGAAGAPVILTAGAQLTVWSALAGGEQVTDLYDASQDAVTVVTSDSLGNVRFYAPADLGTAWVSGDGGTTRFAVQRADTGAVLMDVLARLVVVETALEEAAPGLEAAVLFEERLLALEQVVANLTDDYVTTAGRPVALTIIDGSSADPTEEQIPDGTLTAVVA